MSSVSIGTFHVLLLKDLFGVKCQTVTSVRRLRKMNREEVEKVFENLQKAVVEAKRYEGQILTDTTFRDFWNSLGDVNNDLDYVKGVLSREFNS